MVGTISVAESAKNSNFPLQPIYAFTSAPSHVRLIDVPKQLGTWKITSVSLSIVYPDGTSISSPCVLVGGCWSTTFNGCQTSGKVTNGMTVKADGIDEFGNNVCGYVLGKGDVIVLDGGMDVDPDAEQAAFMRFYSSIPEDPTLGAIAKAEGWQIYTLSGWEPFVPSGLSSYEDIKTQLSADGYTMLDDKQIEAIDSVVAESQTIVKYNDNTISAFDIVGELTYQSIPDLGNVVEFKVGNTVTSIGEYLFYSPIGQTNLVKVTLPDSVTSIGTAAFDGCTNLSSVTIPNSVTSIGDQAFTGCSALTSINIPNSVTSIGNGAFSGCRSLAGLTIPSSVTSIENYAFLIVSGDIKFLDRTMDEVSAMANYPWSATNIVTWNDASQEWVTSRGYALSSDVDSRLSSKQDKLTYVQNAAISSVIDENVTKLKYEITTGHTQGTIFSVVKADASEPVIVDWGDGNVQSYNYVNNYLHRYENNGTYWAKVYNVSSISLKVMYNDDPNSYTLKEVVFGPDIISLYDPFSGCNALTSVVFKDKTMAEVSAMQDYPWGRQSIITTMNQVGGYGVNAIKTLTQAQYDALTTKDPYTMYVIVGS